jgi:hypothetical protein
MTRRAGVRRGRLVALAAASLVTGTAVVGALTGAANPPPAAAAPPAATATLAGAVEKAVPDPADPDDPAPADPDDSAGSAEPAPAPRIPDQQELDGLAATLHPLPRRSGEGRRVVFDMGEQRVWLVRDGDRVTRTYPVSGSIYDNLDPGTYEVYSRSEQAWAFDGSGSMRWMVRFTQGENAAIGFHDIPLEDGKRAQGRDELGTPQSHGCIRQWPDDAKALWRFAPVGTTVVVTA